MCFGFIIWNINNKNLNIYYDNKYNNDDILPDTLEMINKLLVNWLFPTYSCFYQKCKSWWTFYSYILFIFFAYMYTLNTYTSGIMYIYTKWVDEKYEICKYIILQLT